MANKCNTLEELSKHSLNISKYDEIDMVWHKSCIAVRVDKSLRLFRLSHNLKCTDKCIDFIQYNSKVSVNSPVSGLFKFIKKGLSGIDLTQLIMDQAMWPHCANILNEMTDVSTFKWAPEGIWNSKSLLAVLNNIGNVDFYRKHRHSWISELDLSTPLKEHFKLIDSHPTNVEELSTAVYALETSAISWAPRINSDKSIFFITAQRNGTLVFWIIKELDKKITAEVIIDRPTDFKEIVTVSWIFLDSREFLICSNIFGQLFLLECAFNDRHVTVLNSHILWAHQDRMVIKNVSYIIREDKVILLCNKHRHLLLLMLSKNCEILYHSINNIDDNKIVSIHKQNEDFYVITSSNLFKINLNIGDESVNESWTLIDIKDANPNNEFLSISMSHSGTMIALGMIDRRIMCRKEPLQFNLRIFNREKDISDIDLLMNNPSKRLTDHWDCIELIRYKAMKFRKIPALNYKQLLYEGETDLYKMKLYLIFATICDNLETNFKIARGSLPKISIKYVKEKICALHANSVIDNLYVNYLAKNLTLPCFAMETYIGCGKFIKYFNEKYQNIAHVSNEFIDLIKTEVAYTCQCCFETIDNFSCKNGHLNSFCCLTFTPIETEFYLVCKGCGVTARKELAPEEPLCIFCDLPLEDTSI